MFLDRYVVKITNEKRKEKNGMNANLRWKFCKLIARLALMFLTFFTCSFACVKNSSKNIITMNGTHEEQPGPAEQGRQERPRPPHILAKFFC